MKARVHNRLSEDRGWVVITAIFVMVLMLGLGIALLSIVDTQTSQSRKERERESSFNLTEGALYAQSVTLQNNWPTVPPSAVSGATCGPVIAPALPARSCAYGRYTSVTPTDLTSGTPCVYTNGALTGATNQCPTVAELQSAFKNVDAFQNGTWYLQVRDNRDSTGAASTTYDRNTVNTAACQDANGTAVVCTWDQNGDRRLWVRATGIVRGKTRRMVALLQLEKQRVPFPSNVLTAQSVQVTNNGNDVVDGTGSQVALRCGFSDTTTTSALVRNSSTSVTIATPANGAPVANEGAYIDAGSSQELVTITNVSGNTITFTPKVSLDHASGVAFKLGPSGTSGVCSSWDAKKDQVSADQYLYGQSWPPAMTDGTYNAILADPTTKVFDTCPTNLTAAGWSGTVVIKNSGNGDPTLNSGACTINLTGGSSGTINGPLAGGNPTACTNYGMIIVQSGTLRLDGNQVFCGIIYMRNQAPSISGPVFATGGSAQVVGAVAVDGAGSVVVGSGCGSCGGSILYDPNAAGQVGVAGTAGLVQNTWRELSPAQ